MQGMHTRPASHPTMRRQLTRALSALVLVPVLAAATTPTARPTAAAPTSRAATLDTAVFAGGCFWGVEGVFEHVRGVRSATAGYAGGTAAAPSYEQVSTGGTGHAESVRVVYDPARVSYSQLLDVFFRVAHDPTELNRQGPDVGTQYRSAIFYRTPAQKAAIEQYVAQLRASHAFAKPIVTQIAPLARFNEAEAYHQGYMAKHPDAPYIVYNDAPKVVELKKRFAALYQA